MTWVRRTNSWTDWHASVIHKFLMKTPSWLPDWGRFPAQSGNASCSLNFFFSVSLTWCTIWVHSVQAAWRTVCGIASNRRPARVRSWHTGGRSAPRDPSGHSAVNGGDRFCGFRTNYNRWIPCFRLTPTTTTTPAAGCESPVQSCPCPCRFHPNCGRIIMVLCPHIQRNMWTPYHAAESGGGGGRHHQRRGCGDRRGCGGGPGRLLP